MIRKVALLTLIFAVFTHSKANPFAQMARNFAAQKVGQIRKNFTAQAKTLPPSVPTNPIDYSLNLMWINKELKKEQKFITPDKENVQEKLLNPLFGWAEKNPEAQSVTLLIDSQMTPPQAITNTKNLINELNKKQTKKIAPIIIQDIRQFPEVKKNADAFSDKVPVYTRADLLRVIAAVNAISKGKTKNFVYADLDVTPMTKEELFDYSTQKNLQNYGFVMGKRKYSIVDEKWENSFQITTNQQPHLITAMKEALIETNINRIKEALKKGTAQSKPHQTSLHEIIYESYPLMFIYFLHLDGRIILYVKDEYGKFTKPYNRKSDGLQPFGDHPINSTIGIKLFELEKFSMPTKEVDFPAIKNYYE